MSYRTLVLFGLIGVLGMVSLVISFFRVNIEPSDSQTDAALFDIGVRVPAQTPEPPAFFETWQQGIRPTTWKAWGEPLPVIKKNTGREADAAFDPMGDRNYESGVVSRFDVLLEDGVAVEFWAKGRTTALYWQSLNVGLSQAPAAEYGGIEGQPGPLFHTYIAAETDINFVAYRVGADELREPFPPLNDSWHHFRMELDGDGSVRFYRDGKLKFAPETQVDLELYRQAPLIIHGRSEETDMLVDDVALYGTLVQPEAVVLTSLSPHFRGGTVLAGERDVARHVAVGDLDGNGYDDIIAALNGGSNQIVAWQNPGGLTDFPWPEQTIGKSRAPFVRIVPVDLDGDGDLDLASGSGRAAEHELLVWENTGAPFGAPWSPRPVGAIPNEIAALQAADLDEDGDMDLISGSLVEVPVELLLWENDGDPFAGLWPRHELGATDDSVYAIAAADLDRDGDLDIVSGGRRDEDMELIAWRNHGTPFAGHWPATDVGASPGDINVIKVVDLDGDGWLDLVSGSTDQPEYEVVAWRNDGTPFAGAWPETPIGTSETHTRGLIALDLDGHGPLELVGASLEREQLPELLIWHTAQTPFAGPWTSQPLGETGEHIRWLADADLDRDGDRDLISAGQSMVVVWENGSEE